MSNYTVAKYRGELHKAEQIWDKYGEGIAIRYIRPARILISNPAKFVYT